jgi:cytochrome c-type biogenesis protein CcmF
MVPEIGHFALILALLIAIVQFTLPLWGAHTGNQSLMAIARPAAAGQFFFVAIAFACLTYAFVTDDFSVTYAAGHSNSLLPMEYKVAAVWGGHEGSLLLWLLMLTGWGFAVAIFSRKLPMEMVARVIGVLGFVAIGFYLFTMVTSNPFDRMLPPALDGRDLNPLLQDPGLIIHPPLLYMGYVGFSVAFAFAIAALLSGKMDAAWARWSRPWTTIAWVFLTLGIALGSWWAYYELGWGGWWFWDPVENASFMPWLVGTALVHSLAVTEKRGSFKNWTVLLAILAFSLSLLGTFLVRSGVLTSVHAFAADPDRGMAILIFLCVVIGLSLALYAWRAPSVGLGGKFSMYSREVLLLGNNVLLVVAMGAVLIGTLAPLVFDVLELGKISVGPPYFDLVFSILIVPLLFLCAIGPMVRWKEGKPVDTVVRLKWAFISALVAAILIPLMMGHINFGIALGMFLATWIIASIISSIVQRVRSRETRAGKGGTFSRSYYGMQLAHFGVAVLVIGVVLVSGYESQKDVRMDIGDTVEVAGYTFRFDGTKHVKGPNYESEMGMVTVFRDGRTVTVLNPEKRHYGVASQVMTEAGIRSGFFGDLYVSLGEPVARGAWSVRVYYKPFVNWIWGGCAIMSLGGLLAVTDRRYRIGARKDSKAKDKLRGATVNAKPEVNA